jgi:hypothetical protein
VGVKSFAKTRTPPESEAASGVSGTLIWWVYGGLCYEGSASQTQGRAKGSSRRVRIARSYPLLRRKLASFVHIGSRTVAWKLARLENDPPLRRPRPRRALSLRVGVFSFVSDTRGLRDRAGRNRFDCALTNLGGASLMHHRDLHPSALDVSASRLTTGQFVLLPKNLVTGVEKVGHRKSSDPHGPGPSGR